MMSTSSDFIKYIGDMKPVEVLYDYGKPYIFTTRSSTGDLLFMYEYCEDRMNEFFVAVKTTQQDVDDLMALKKTIRNVLESNNSSIMVIMTVNKFISIVTETDIKNLPQDMMPAPGTYI